MIVEPLLFVVRETIQISLLNYSSYDTDTVRVSRLSLLLLFKYKLIKTKVRPFDSINTERIKFEIKLMTLSEQWRIMK